MNSMRAILISGSSSFSLDESELSEEDVCLSRLGNTLQFFLATLSSIQGEKLDAADFLVDMSIGFFVSQSLCTSFLFLRYDTPIGFLYMFSLSILAKAFARRESLFSS